MYVVATVVTLPANTGYVLENKANQPAAMSNTNNPSDTRSAARSAIFQHLIPRQTVPAPETKQDYLQSNRCQAELQLNNLTTLVQTSQQLLHNSCTSPVAW